MAPPGLDLDSVEATSPFIGSKSKEFISVAHSNGQIGSEVHRYGVRKESHPILDPLYEIIEQPIGTRRPIRVACMGAGYSGLMMGILFSQKMTDKNAELVIYERNADLGGTWFENR